MNKRFIATSLTMIMTLGLTAAQCCSSAFAGEKEPTEIISKRSEYEKHFDNGDGTYSAYINTVPIHYLDGDEWVEIDNSLIKDGKGNYTNSSSALHITLPSVLSDKDNGIHLAYNGYSLDVSPDSEVIDSAAIITQPEQNGSAYSQLPKAAADVFGRTVSSVRYDSVYGNNDLNIEIRPDSVIESVEFDNSEDVPEMLSFKLASEELVPEENENNCIYLVNGSGEKVFEIPSIMIMDSSDDPTAIPVPFEITTEEDGYLLSLSPSDAIENNNGINYPLIMSTSYSTQINASTFYNSEYHPNNTYYDDYIRFGNRSGHGYQTYVSCSNTFGGFGQYATILDADFMMRMEFNNITEPKPCELYSVNSQPVNCTWNNAATLNSYNTKISDFTTSAADTYLWVGVDFTKLAQSWKNYADSSYAVGVPAYGFKIVTTSSPAATVSATSERATNYHPYYSITYSISSTYTLDYAPQKYDNIIDSSHGSIYNFQNRMNCYAYALQMYNRGGYQKLNPGQIGLTYNPSASTCNQLNSLYSSQTSLSNFQAFTQQQLFYDALKMDTSIATITLSNNNQFVLPSSYDESSERIIAMNCGGIYNPYSSTPEGYDFHFYVRHGNGTCGNPSHGSTCSKWSHKMALGTVSDKINNTLLCDNNIATLAKSASRTYQSISGTMTVNYNSTPKFYFIEQDTNLYNSWYTYVSSTDTVTFTN
jgi:hypothetical protein